MKDDERVVVFIIALVSDGWILRITTETGQG